VVYHRAGIIGQGHPTKGDDDSCRKSLGSDQRVIGGASEEMKENSWKTMKNKISKSILIVILIFPLLACSFVKSSESLNITSVQFSDLDPDSYIKIGLGRVYKTKYSPDSNMLAVATSTGVLLYDTNTYQPLKYFPDSFVDNLEWSPDSTKLAYSSQDHIKLLDIQSEIIMPFEEKGTWVVGKEMSWSPDGKLLASIDSTDIDGAVYVWDTISGSATEKIIHPEKRIFGRYIYSKGVAWSPDGKYLSIAYGFQNISAPDKASDIIVWSISSQAPKIYNQWSISNIFMEGIEWTHDGKYLILGGNPLTIFAVKDGSVVNKIETRDSGRFSISPNGNILLIPSSSVTSTLSSGNELVNPLGKTEASVSSYTIPKLKKTLEFNGRIYSPETVDISPDERFVVAGDSFIDGFEVWDFQKQEIVKSISLDSHWNDGIKFSPDGKYFVALGRDNVLHLYKTEDGRLLQTIENGVLGLSDELSWARNGWSKQYSPVLSPNGKWLASTGIAVCETFFCVNNDYAFTVQSNETKEILFRYKIDSFPLLRWSPDSEWLIATGSPLQQGLTIYSIAQKSSLLQILEPMGDIEGIDWSSNGEFIVATGYNGVIYLFKADKILGRFFGIENGISAP
jgi:WD40 repeat protein